MCEMSDILKRGKFSNFISYLTYATGENGHVIESYDEAIKESYEMFYTRIEKLYSEANRNDDELFDIATNFACTHDDIYFETGMLVGFQLYKDFEKNYISHSKSDITSLLDRMEHQKIQLKKNKTNSDYTEMIYSQGFKDAVQFLKDCLKNEK